MSDPELPPFRGASVTAPGLAVSAAVGAVGLSGETSEPAER